MLNPSPMAEPHLCLPNWVDHGRSEAKLTVDYYLILFTTANPQRSTRKFETHTHWAFARSSTAVKLWLGNGCWLLRERYLAGADLHQSIWSLAEVLRPNGLSACAAGSSARFGRTLLQILSVVSGLQRKSYQNESWKLGVDSLTQERWPK